MLARLPSAKCSSRGVPPARVVSDGGKTRFHVVGDNNKTGDEVQLRSCTTALQRTGAYEAQSEGKEGTVARKEEAAREVAGDEESKAKRWHEVGSGRFQEAEWPLAAGRLADLASWPEGAVDLWCVLRAACCAAPCMQGGGEKA